MGNDKEDIDRWVDQRLASLAPSSEWRPDSVAAFARFRRRRNARGHKWWIWATLSFAAAVVCAAIVLVSAPPACANPLGCKQPGPISPPSAPPAAVPPAPIAPPAATPKPAAIRSFRQTGSPTAPVTCEVYTDFECPHCATFYLETLPQLTADFVQSGKVRIVHRNFPLRQHRYAGLAAQYADAAGELGYYDAAVTRLFRLQPVWSGDGDIAAALAPALPADVMAKVRKRVASPDQFLAADEAAAQSAGLNSTPTVVLTHGATREVITGIVSYADLKQRIESALSAK